jgi:cobalt-zinc-cadmium efflux system membrane fusion protein
MVALTDAEAKAIELETVKVAARSLRTLHSAMGKVLAPQTRLAIVSYAFPARISAVHVQIGDWVEQGQALLTLQSEEVGLARSEYYKAIADLELANTDWEREKRLHDRGVGARKNLLAAEAELKVARAHLDLAEKKLHVLGFSEDQVRVISETHQVNPVIQLFAPIRGKIVNHNAVLGSMIDQSAELLTIMDPSTLWIDAEIFERDIAKIRIGQRVEATVPAYPGEKFIGKVTYISDTLNDTTRTIIVRTEVENRSFKLKPGMFADIVIFLNHHARVAVLPCRAILDDESEQIVFVEDQGSFARRVVQVGAKDDGYCEIREGVEVGERVVTTGNYQLKSKMYVELLDQSHVH